MTASVSTPPKIDRPLNVIVATDCGSTTTKAILIEKVGDEYRQTYRGEAPTTVEAPFEDVTRGRAQRHRGNRGTLRAGRFWTVTRSSRLARMTRPASISISPPAAPAVGCR